MSPLYFAEKINHTRWATSKALEELIKKAENAYTDTFCHGNRHIGMQKLRFPNTKNRTFHGVSWRAGVYIGIAIILLLQSIVIVSHPAYPHLHDPLYVLSLHLYGTIMIPVMLAVLFTLNLYQWSETNINYSFIFEFDYRHQMHYMEFLEFTSSYFLLLAIFIYLTFSNSLLSIGIYPTYMPVILLSIYGGIIIAPINRWYPNARIWLVKTMYRIGTAPYTKVQFRDFFIADQLVSLSYSLIIFQLLSCYSSLPVSESSSSSTKTSEWSCSFNQSWGTPFLAALPPYWRLVQCLRRYYDSKRVNPHLINAGKYGMSIVGLLLGGTVRITGATSAFPLWIIAITVSSLYGFSWDILMDWGFLQPNSKNKYLRDRLFYNKIWVYYFSIVLNFILRLSWIVLVFPDVWNNILNRDSMSWILAFLEMIRRWQWNFYRMENEHATNCGAFRATLEIPIPKFEPSSEEDHDLEPEEKYGNEEDEEKADLVKMVMKPRATNLLDSYKIRDYDRNDTDESRLEMEMGAQFQRSRVLELDVLNNTQTGDNLCAQSTNLNVGNGNSSHIDGNGDEIEMIDNNDVRVVIMDPKNPVDVLMNYEK